jgi:hypothetical protein
MLARRGEEPYKSAHALAGEGHPEQFDQFIAQITPELGAHNQDYNRAWDVLKRVRSEVAGLESTVRHQEKRLAAAEGQGERFVSAAEELPRTEAARTKLKAKRDHILAEREVTKKKAELEAYVRAQGTATARAAATRAPEVEGDEKIYIVKAGDTVERIANRNYDISGLTSAERVAFFKDFQTQYYEGGYKLLTRGPHKGKMSLIVDGKQFKLPKTVSWKGRSFERKA